MTQSLLQFDQHRENLTRQYLVVELLPNALQECLQLRRSYDVLAGANFVEQLTSLPSRLCLLLGRLKLVLNSINVEFSLFHFLDELEQAILKFPGVFIQTLVVSILPQVIIEEKVFFVWHRFCRVKMVRIYLHLFFG